jgi:hypothetical protein
LEDRQFSVTTKLTGSADFALIDAWGDRRAVPSGQTPTEDIGQHHQALQHQESETFSAEKAARASGV